MLDFKAGLGAHSMHGVIDQHITPNAFNEIVTINQNARWLYALYENIGIFQQLLPLKDNQDIVRLISKLKDLEKLSTNLQSVLSVNDSLAYLHTVEPLLTDISSSVKEIKKDYDDFTAKKHALIETLKQFKEDAVFSLKDETQTLQKGLCEYVERVTNDFNSKHEKVKQQLATIEDAVRTEHIMKQELDTMRCYIAKSYANACVDDWEHMPNSQTKAIAIGAVEKSESLGNSETVNRLRLKGKVNG